MTEFTINGIRQQLDLDPDTRSPWAIRDTT
jgi:hypothetical protein